MLPRSRWFLLAPSLASCVLDPSTPFWIVTSNTSRMPGEMLYLMEAGSSDDGALQTWRMDYTNPDPSGKFLLYPGGMNDLDTYYLVGDFGTRAAGFMLYLDQGGVTQVCMHRSATDGVQHTDKMRRSTSRLHTRQSDARHSSPISQTSSSGWSSPPSRHLVTHTFLFCSLLPPRTRASRSTSEVPCRFALAPLLRVTPRQGEGVAVMPQR